MEILPYKKSNLHKVRNSSLRACKIHQSWNLSF